MRSAIVSGVLTCALAVAATTATRQPVSARTRAVPPSQDAIFEHYELVIGSAARQTVMTGFLLDGPLAEIAVVHVAANGNRRLRLFVFGDDRWSAGLEAILDSTVDFVDVAEIGGRDRLVTYAAGRISWFDPVTATQRDLAAVTSSFEPPRDDEVPHVDITRDLVVPDVDGFWVLVQMPDGSFADAIKIGPPAEMGRILGAEGYRYDPWSVSRIHEIDHDRDGRVDLVFWAGDAFDVHVQEERGTFAADAASFMSAVSFDADELSFLTDGGMAGRVLHSLADVNGDLVVYTLQGSDITSKRSSYEVHFGAPGAEDETVFAPVADLIFAPEGRIHLGLQLHDLDRDGRPELMFTTIDLDYLEGSLWKRIKGAMGDDVWLDLEFYRMRGGGYPDAPDATRRIALDGVPSPREPGWVPLKVVLEGATHVDRPNRVDWPRAFNTTLRIGDVTGDGRSDLIIGDHPRILDVFLGVAGSQLFAPEPREVDVAVPNDEEYVWLVDLDQDGKQDIVLHQPFLERNAHGAPTEAPGTGLQRVVTLIGR